MYTVGLSSNIEDFFSEEFREYHFDTYDDAKRFADAIIESSDANQIKYCFTTETKGLNWYFPSCTESGDLDTDYEIEDDTIDSYLLMFILGDGEVNEGYNTVSYDKCWRRDYKINRIGHISWDSDWID